MIAPNVIYNITIKEKIKIIKYLILAISLYKTKNIFLNFYERKIEPYCDIRDTIFSYILKILIKKKLYINFFTLYFLQYNMLFSIPSKIRNVFNNRMIRHINIRKFRKSGGRLLNFKIFTYFKPRKRARRLPKAIRHMRLS